jgi:hypothetical protein
MVKPFAPENQKIEVSVFKRFWVCYIYNGIDPPVLPLIKQMLEYGDEE